jgi:hypothetical protein
MYHNHNMKTSQQNAKLSNIGVFTRSSSTVVTTVKLSQFMNIPKHSKCKTWLSTVKISKGTSIMLQNVIKLSKWQAGNLNCTVGVFTRSSSTVVTTVKLSHFMNIPKHSKCKTWLSTVKMSKGHKHHASQCQTVQMASREFELHSCHKC